MQAVAFRSCVGASPACPFRKAAPGDSIRGAGANRIVPLRPPFQTQRQARGLEVRAVASTTPKINAAAVEAKPAEAVAHLRGTRGSAHKLRRVLDQIRGRTYEEALMMLEFMPYRACEPIMQTLISAASNAKNNQGMSKTKLFISECFADESAKLKRFRPRAKGRPFKILKPVSHLTIKVQEKA